MSTEAKVAEIEGPTLFGHPSGLFLLFFAEMWERFSYYGMRALLIFYMIKGFLAYGDNEAYKVYGAYVGLVYMTPFFGGLLADKMLGAKRAVILGGLFMAAGHLMMTVEDQYFFFAALALLIVGNGFFKPNISTIVGSLYPDGHPGRDGGFTIFYMGINLGAAMSPLLCGYVGETYGWHYGFGLATIGMLFGLAVFMIPGFIGQSLTAMCALCTMAALGLGFMDIIPESALVPMNLAILVLLIVAGIAGFAELKREEKGLPPLSPEFPKYSRYSAMVIIGGGSLTTAAIMFGVQESNLVVQSVVGFVSLALTAAGIAGSAALMKGGLPKGAGLAPDPDLLHTPVAGPLTREHLTYLGAASVVPMVALLVFSNRTVKVIPDEFLKGLADSSSAIVRLSGTLLGEMSTPTGLILTITGVIALVFLMRESFRSPKIERERLWVVVSLMFFSMMFWAFFEQAGSSMNNFTDRNVDRVAEEQVIASADVGTTINLDLNQEQLGMVNADPGFAAVVNGALQRQVAKRSCLGLDGEFAEATDDASAHCSLSSDEIAAKLAAMTAKEREAFTPEPYIFAAGEALNLTALDAVREGKMGKGVAWQIVEGNVGMGVNGAEVRASMFQSANAIFIVIFGLVFTAMWTEMARRNIEPSTPVKFAFGLFLLGLGFVALWYSAGNPDSRGMVNANWLLLAYLLHTLGELCLSPVGLSMVTKLTPKRVVSTAMGAWFLATAFSGFLAAIIATFTGVSHGGEGPQIIPVPSETVHVYGDVFGIIAWTTLGCAAFCLACAPIFLRWMHVGEDVEGEPQDPATGGKAAADTSA